MKNENLLMIKYTDSVIHCRLRAAMNPLRPGPQRFADYQLRKQRRNIYVFVDLFTKDLKTSLWPKLH